MLLSSNFATLLSWPLLSTKLLLMTHAIIQQNLRRWIVGYYSKKDDADFNLLSNRLVSYTLVTGLRAALLYLVH